ncbi:MAG: c-type cytochrome [Deltaproteobacteria bacterium]|nr:c-type cytochrome [Deltaproteobacteria bacterium]
MAKGKFTSNRGLVEEEEKRSYGAVFLLIIGVLVACTVWAVWQDTFSRHEWKKYKADFYRLAIEKYELQRETELVRLAEDPAYGEALAVLEQTRLDLASGEAAEELSRLAREKSRAEVIVMETDLDNRVVKSEIEEAWYRVEFAKLHGESGDSELAAVAALEGRQEVTLAAFEGAEVVVAALEAAAREIREREEQAESDLLPFLAELGSIGQKLDSVSFEMLGMRVANVPVVEQVVLADFQRNNFDQLVSKVERCQNCHVAIDKSGFEEEENPFRTHPDRKYYLGNHEVKKFGCTPCHGGEGSAINEVERAHGGDHYWEDPLVTFEGGMEARCLSCHVSLQGMEKQDAGARGERLFQELGCHGCHLAYGFDHLAKVAPSLKRVAAKDNPEWLVDWVADPTAFRPRTRMPDFLLERDEAEAIVAYLLSDSLEESVTWLDTADSPVGVDPGNAGLVAEGKALTRSLGCLGCHGFAADEFASHVADGKDVAPNLARVAEKTTGLWLYNWIRNPRGFSSHTKMPSLRLAVKEAGAITSYLLTLREGDPREEDGELRGRLAKAATVDQGEKLIRKYGCFGCHEIDGMKGQLRIGAELSFFGSKFDEELYFGNRTDVAHTWYDYTYHKVIEPRGYATDRIGAVMPEFNLSEKDALALVAFLSSRTESKTNSRFMAHGARDIEVARGREVVNYYNCNGCHTLEGSEGKIRKYYENLENAPPILEGEGTKLQQDWFFDFLLKPVRLRPWLDVRMPTFGMSSEEADAVVKYFSGVDGYDLGAVVTEGGEEAGPSHVPAVHANPSGLDCAACHAEGKGKLASERFAVSRKPLTEPQANSWMEENLGVEKAAPPAGADSLGAFLGVSAR